MRAWMRLTTVATAAAVLAAPGPSDAQARGGGGGRGGGSIAIGGVMRGGPGPGGVAGGGGRVGAPGGGGRGTPGMAGGWGGRPGGARPGAGTGRWTGLGGGYGYYGRGTYGNGHYGGGSYGKGYGARFRHRPIVPTVIVYPWVAPYYGYGAYWDGYAPAGYGSDAWSDEDDEPRVPRTQVVEAAPVVPDVAMLVVESANEGATLRLRWTGRDPSVREVMLSIADASRREIASRTLREAPFAAQFDRAGRVAFVGVTVVRADGVTTTTLVPLEVARGR